MKEPQELLDIYKKIRAIRDSIKAHYHDNALEITCDCLMNELKDYIEKEFTCKVHDTKKPWEEHYRDLDKLYAENRTRSVYENNRSVWESNREEDISRLKKEIEGMQKMQKVMEMHIWGREMCPDAPPPPEKK